MKKIIIMVIIAIQFTSLSQDKRETVYIYIDLKSTKELCNPIRKSNSFNNQAYNKEENGTKIVFTICKEKFIFNKKNSFKDISSKHLEKFKIETLSYLLLKHKMSKSFKHDVFEKIFLIEKINDDQFRKYEVFWNDQRLGVID